MFTINREQDYLAISLTKSGNALLNLFFYEVDSIREGFTSHKTHNLRSLPLKEFSLLRKTWEHFFFFNVHFNSFDPVFAPAPLKLKMLICFTDQITFWYTPKFIYCTRRCPSIFRPCVVRSRQPRWQSSPSRPSPPPGTGWRSRCATCFDLISHLLEPE